MGLEHAYVHTYTPHTHTWKREYTLNVIVEWLTLLLHVREVPGLNLGTQTGYLHRTSSWFSSVHRNVRIVP
jgi:hypothetical protein